MFTAEQLKAAHSKVKSGADFPAYMREIKELGVTHYEAYVSDGRIDYHGNDNYTVQVSERYDPIQIAAQLNVTLFKAELLAHQQGKTDYITFIRMCAENGIEKWKIRMDDMTCTYYDLAQNEILTEQIPQ
ncbi:DUF1398 domain-containing protein [Sphingobacterium corticibacter]|uniref:Phage envelope protein n=1 Tax=Sphingobacterium corticibacter TaxID=2171749 RepID=A0A2T8HGS7_9SPHI|nr:DUF1398 family protein [Sphingobacterium corticibacter]PVH24631.1 phage envelope protein [Sphingobacterium corticibacter]